MVGSRTLASTRCLKAVQALIGASGAVALWGVASPRRCGGGANLSPCGSGSFLGRSGRPLMSLERRARPEVDGRPRQRAPRRLALIAAWAPQTWQTQAESCLHQKRAWVGCNGSSPNHTLLPGTAGPGGCGTHVPSAIQPRSAAGEPEGCLHHWWHRVQCKRCFPRR